MIKSIFLFIKKYKYFISIGMVMNNYSIVDSIEYSNKSFLLRMADESLASLRVVCNGRRIYLDEEENETENKTYQLGLQIFAGLFVLFTLPVTLIALAVKWWKKEEWQQAILQKLRQNEPDMDMDIEIQGSEEEGIIPEEKEDFIAFIQEELVHVHDVEAKLSDPLPGSWRHYGANHGEFNQTLPSYIKMLSKAKAWPDRRPLYIQCMGNFSESDLKIASITADYLGVFHNVRIKLCKNILSVEQLKDKYLKLIEENRQKPVGEEQEALENWYGHWEKQIKKSFPRANGQYLSDLALEFMSSALIPELEKEAEEQVQAIILTSEDLFSSDLGNFVFGTASLTDRVGIWSNARFGDPSSSPKEFETCLLRMMKISTHEFGHMQHLSHCTDYECNIGGYMSLKELDNRPLLYCLQDTAKICYLTHTSLLEYHKKILKFYQNFNETYKLNCNFSKEVRTLKERISYLNRELESPPFRTS